MEPSPAPPQDPNSRKTLHPSADFVAEMANQKPAPPIPQAPSPPVPGGPLPDQPDQPPTPEAPIPEVKSLSAAPQEYIDAHTKVGLFDSVPKGVMVIVFLAIMNALGVFLVSGNGTTANTSVLLVATLISVGLSIGLLFASNICRIIFITVCVLGAFGNTLNLFRTMDIQQNLGRQKQAAQANLDKLKDLSPYSNTSVKYDSSLKNQIETQQANLDRLNQITGASLARVYLIYIASIGYEGFVIIYLIRPSIKQYFSV